jgi:hypothetical protein
LAASSVCRESAEVAALALDVDFQGFLWPHSFDFSSALGGDFEALIAASFCGAPASTFGWS